MLEASGIGQECSKVQKCPLIHGNRQEAKAMAELEEYMLSMPIDFACGLLDTLCHLGMCREVEPCKRPDTCQGMDAQPEQGVPRTWKWKMICINNDHNICSSWRPIVRAGFQVKKGEVLGCWSCCGVVACLVGMTTDTQRRPVASCWGLHLV